MRTAVRALVCTTAVALVLVGAPAHASGELGLSLDRASWSAQLRTPIFPESHVWVPGDTKTRTVYARNQSQDPAVLSVALVGPDAAQLLQRGGFSVTADAGGARTRMESTRSSLTMQAAGPGEIVPVTVTVKLNEAAGNQWMRRDQHVSLRFTLRQDVSEDAAAPSRGELGNFGALFGRGFLVGAAGVLLLGLLLVVASRRERTE